MTSGLVKYSVSIEQCQRSTKNLQTIFCLGKERAHSRPYNPLTHDYCSQKVLMIKEDGISEKCARKTRY